VTRTSWLSLLVTRRVRTSRERNLGEGLAPTVTARYWYYQ